MIKVVQKDLGTALLNRKELETDEIKLGETVLASQARVKHSGQVKKKMCVYLDSIEDRLADVERNIDELEELAAGHHIDRFLPKARQLTEDICKLGAAEAMKTCIAIQLVSRLHLISRLQHLIDELRYNLYSFKQNLILFEA